MSNFFVWAKLLTTSFPGKAFTPFPGRIDVNIVTKTACSSLGVAIGVSVCVAGPYARVFAYTQTQHSKEI